MTNLESPTGPKLKRKKSAEPTMTLHTKAATEDILDIFNQPLRNVDPMAGPDDSAGESDDDDDDYTSAGESTGTGRISGTSEFGDTEPDIKDITAFDDTNNAAVSVSPWSEFTASKHVPNLETCELEENGRNGSTTDEILVLEDAVPTSDEKDEQVDLMTPVSPEQENESMRPRYVPIPPEDYEPPTRPYRDPSQASQNRLPFMTPIVEKTESSMGALTIREEKDYFNSKTPSRHQNLGHATPQIDEEFLSSPLEEIVNEAPPPRVPKLKIAKSKGAVKPTKESKGPIIGDAQCNPVDESIRNSILESIQPPLSSYSGYYDYRPLTCNKAPEIRKFIKALVKAKSGSDKTTTSISMPPTLRFPQASTKTYTVKRELGKGAFAPVYLAEEEDGTNPEETTYLAMKCEHPPTAWEFYIMSLLQSRLPRDHRASTSLLKPHSLHLFADEGYLLETYLDQGTLLDLVNLAKSDPTNSTSGTLDESVAMFFTVELLRTVEAMHAVGVLHGDLKADNCLVRLSSRRQPDDKEEDGWWDPTYRPDGAAGWASKGLCLIDFGRGIDLRAFRSDVGFLADWKTGKQDCVEMRELRPWTYQVDYWGVAGVVHNLLFGKYIDDVVVVPVDESNGTRGGGGGASISNSNVHSGIGVGVGQKKKYKLKEGLKRYWRTDLWAPLWDILLNPAANAAADGEEGEIGGKMPCVKGLARCRVGMEEWLAGEGGRRNGGLKAALRRVEERIRERKGR